MLVLAKAFDVAEETLNGERPHPLKIQRTQPGCGCEHECGRGRAVHDFEFAPLRNCGLVNVPAEYELDARCGEGGEHPVALLQRELPRRAPRCARKMVVERGDPERLRGRVREYLPDAVEANT